MNAKTLASILGVTIMYLKDVVTLKSRGLNGTSDTKLFET